MKSCLLKSATGMLTLATLVTGCVPALGLRAGAGTNSVDHGARTVIEADVGMYDLRSANAAEVRSGPPILYAFSTEFYEGHNDILAFGPKVGGYFFPGKLAVQAQLGAETGPIFVRDGDNGWYYGGKGNVALMTAWGDKELDFYYPTALVLQIQYGQRRSTADWNGKRLGFALMFGFTVP